MNARQVGPVAALLAVLALVVGCASSGGAGSPGGVRVVASTDVYGDIVEQIGGDRVDVTSIISDPAQDPHSYEADARTELALSRAAVVIENGGGYDPFVGRLLAAAGTRPVVLDAVTISGRTAPVGGELNEHVWYDLPSMRRLATRIAAALATAEPADASFFRANADRFAARLARLESTEASIRRAHAGAGVAVTEPVPLYMLQACGLVNRTSPAFSQAIESGEGVSVRVLDATLTLLRDHRVDLLAYNEQTAGVETTRVAAAARQSGVAVVPVTETLPPDTGYVGWMADNLRTIGAALA